MCLKTRVSLAICEAFDAIEWCSSTLIVDLERLIGTHVQSLRNLNWREYKSYALEAIVDNFGEVYSKVR